ncbi:hypothetical protein P43SY_008270 [Pythium insidiosum]|uniref:Protein kinase domain-containing protein n=1 Tax=Pythium insidiosum TaxID=114742 RepID=A0AAD5MAB6_PYTIN|nr:hypothetical protein P43SY_008270 [Pythium insidiosum]
MVKFSSLLLVVAGALASFTAADDAVKLPHWVGPLKGKPIDNACYRKSYIAKNKQCSVGYEFDKSYIAKNKQCSVGYEFDKVATCWTECPLEYPVECGMECLPQNADCTKAVFRKIFAVGNAVLSTATSGVFGKITQASKGVQRGVKCGQQLHSVIGKVVSYIDEVEGGMGGAIDTKTDQVMYIVSKSDLVVRDLPIAVTTCLGLPAPKGLDQVDQVIKVVKAILENLRKNRKRGVNVLKPDNFVNFTSNVGIGDTVSGLSQQDKDFLKKLVQTGTTCGGKIKNVVDKVIKAVEDIKREKPSTAVDIIRFGILNSEIVLKDLPEATVGCYNQNAPDGFKTRDEIVKTVHVIIDKIVDSASQNGNPVSLDKFALTVADMGLDAIAVFDPTGIAAMAKEFVQPICGPTAFIGDIDDGPAEQALGLATMQKAFRGTTGKWTKQGDGKIRITFRSVDEYDVKVNIFSGGNKFDQVKVAKGQTVTWERPISQVAGKTMYMDRWRPGFLGLPGTGGGSVNLWVPMDNDGSLTLDVPINPTSFFDKNLRCTPNATPTIPLATAKDSPHQNGSVTSNAVLQDYSPVAREPSARAEPASFPHSSEALLAFAMDAKPAASSRSSEADRQALRSPLLEASSGHRPTRVIVDFPEEEHPSQGLPDVSYSMRRKPQEDSLAVSPVGSAPPTAGLSRNVIGSRPAMAMIVPHTHAVEPHSTSDTDGQHLAMIHPFTAPAMTFLPLQQRQPFTSMEGSPPRMLVAPRPIPTTVGPFAAPHGIHLAPLDGAMHPTGDPTFPGVGWGGGRGRGVPPNVAPIPMMVPPGFRGPVIVGVGHGYGPHPAMFPPHWPSQDTANPVKPVPVSSQERGPGSRDHGAVSDVKAARDQRQRSVSGTSDEGDGDDDDDDDDLTDDGEDVEDWGLDDDTATEPPTKKPAPVATTTSLGPTRPPPPSPANKQRMPEPATFSRASALEGERSMRPKKFDLDDAGIEQVNSDGSEDNDDDDDDDADAWGDGGSADVHDWLDDDDGAATATHKTAPTGVSAVPQPSPPVATLASPQPPSYRSNIVTNATPIIMPLSNGPGGSTAPSPASSVTPTALNGGIREVKVVKKKKAELPQHNLPHPAPKFGDWLNQRTMINNYIILETLGTGGYAEVKLCKEKVTGKLYAMKFINRDLMKKDKLGKQSKLDDIKREIAIMKKLNHPNVLRLYEVMDDPNMNKLFLVLEYMKHGDLLGHLKKKSERNAAARATADQQEQMHDRDLHCIFLQVILGVAYLHEQKIVHGDIKPQNLLVGDKDVVKIADFGISQSLYGSKQKLNDTAGTPAFMSPEMCMEQEYSGQLADIWAVGATIFMLKFGHPPFVANSAWQLFEKIKNDPLVFPGPLDPLLEDLLRGMLTKNPLKRMTMLQIMTHPWVTKEEHSASFMMLRGQQSGHVAKGSRGSDVKATAKYNKVFVESENASEELTGKPDRMLSMEETQYRTQLFTRKKPSAASPAALALPGDHIGSTVATIKVDAVDSESADAVFSEDDDDEDEDDDDDGDHAVAQSPQLLEELLMTTLSLPPLSCNASPSVVPSIGPDLTHVPGLNAPNYIHYMMQWGL